MQDAKNYPWLTLDNASGTNDGVITVNIAENPLFETRSTTIKISMGDLSEVVAVEQEAAIEFKVSGDIIWRFDSRNRTRCTRANEGRYRPNKLIVINSKEELEDYIATWFNQESCDCVCRWNTLPNIDFTTHSVVAAYITDSGGTRIGAVNFQNNVLNVVACLFIAQVISHWTVAIVTDKISGDKVELNIIRATSLQQCEW